MGTKHEGLDEYPSVQSRKLLEAAVHENKEGRGRPKKRRTWLVGEDQNGLGREFVSCRAELRSALVARKENSDANHKEAEAGDPTNDLRTDVLGDQGATQYAQCGSQNQRRRGRREDCPFWM